MGRLDRVREGGSMRIEVLEYWAVGLGLGCGVSR